MKLFRILFFALFTFSVYGQKIPSKKVIKVAELSSFLKINVKKKLSEKGEISTERLANYFRQKFSERYFYDYQTVDNRFTSYSNLYPKAAENHAVRALDHLNKFSSEAQWKLPFNYQNGKPVNAYALRHLARQHKMVDIAFYYFYQKKEDKYIDYFTQQMQSLNRALHQNKFEIIEDGNGVYEAFRSGYRVLNWLQIHNLFLGEKAYSDKEQLTTIATLLQHASYLFERNQEFASGNHQTRGLSALAMVAILLRDFVDTDVWYQHSMKLLAEHLRREINEDGFQFERSVHYHLSDIGNYFYVYQLAKNSTLKVDSFWKNKLESLFTTLTQIAFPDKSAPVFSDDTDTPWAEKNDISNALTLGYLLFENPTFGYFANHKVSSKMYWYAGKSQLENLQNIQKEKPSFNSYAFSETGYYFLREGWELNNKMLAISAGLDSLKPDHQHGDMLGIQAMANGNVILPNYQVRYSLKDLELFKNSMTKNVALVDDELQGKKYTSNKGGSGFGKFKQLPNPKVIGFQDNKDLEVFIGSHDGFENVGVQYSRQVLNVENDFWIVKDNFSSDKNHVYKQVWQGHYSLENSPNLLRSSFQNGSGLDIYQLNMVDKVIVDGARGKQWNVVSKTSNKDFSFITILFPFSKYNNRIDEEKKNPNLKGWVLNDASIQSNAQKTLSKDHKHLFFGVKQIQIKQKTIHFSEKVDVYVTDEKNEIKIQSLFYKSFKVKLSSSLKENHISPLQFFIF
ncbi:heparinase II/III family protein [Polaribacter sp. MSW13]|uniref:Heparinase II/III family protein n=1 Tax=Polaribacter marinus TaxID=2916838 RepID=A0A9X1VL90_9FLAO|nr:heparinase II/III family protein [Polaribacter marinus]MCI2228227.1 heparinase II/III family protein [Polaribacter marinus]